MAQLTVHKNDSSRVKGVKATFNELLAQATIETDAEAHADDPKQALEVAQFLREAAESYEQNNTGHGNICLNRAFEFAQQLQRKSALKLQPDSPAKAKAATKIDNVMQALKVSHLMTLMEVCKHYKAHAYKDKFKDE